MKYAWIDTQRIERLMRENGIRTERSRTSGAYFLVFFMAPSSQEWEPPRKPGRFTMPEPGDQG